MTDNEPNRTDEASIARLLRRAGRGPTASEAARARIYRAVHAQWRESVGARAAAQGTRSASGRRPAGLGFWLVRALPVAAAVAVAVVIFDIAPTPNPTPRAELAAVTQALGTATVAAPGAATASPLSAGSSVIRAGDTITTGPGGAAALALANGPILRIDSGTRVLMASGDAIELERGALYLDSGSDAAPGGALEVDTPYGTVRHLGTQYELRVGGGDLRIRVREGTVGFRNADDGREFLGEAGEQLLITADAERPLRSAISTSGPDWQWVEGLAAVPTADQYPIIELLEWVARETGRELEFASPALADNARTDTLYGVAGLSPAETLEVIGSTTALRYELTGGELRIY